METKDIITNNEAIAKFMGAKHIAANLYSYLSVENSPIPNKGTQYNSPYMLYHKDWSWLMPVVEKIESLNITPLYGKDWIRFSVTIEHVFCKIEHLRVTGSKIISISTSECNSKIQAVHNAVIEFIKWYNLNKQS